MFCKVGTLKNFTKFAEKNLSYNLYFNFIKIEIPAEVFFFVNLAEHLFYRTPLSDYVWIFMRGGGEGQNISKSAYAGYREANIFGFFIYNLINPVWEPKNNVFSGILQCILIGKVRNIGNLFSIGFHFICSFVFY